MFEVLHILSVTGQSYGTRGNSRIDCEQHTVGFAVSETLALRISLACGAASSEGVLRARTVKVIRSGVLGVTDNATAGGPTRVSTAGIPISSGFGLTETESESGMER